MLENDKTEGTPAQPTTPAAAPVDWEARYNGLNKTYQEHRSGWTAKEQQLQALVTDLTGQTKNHEAKISEYEKAKGDWETTVKDMTGKLDSVTQKAATLEKQNGRTTLFMSKYPDLAQFETKGLLRQDLEGEALDKYLTTYSEEIGAIRKNALTDKLAGATPSGSPGVRQDGKMDVETLAKQMDEALNKADFKAYESLMPQWIEATERK